MDDLFLIPPREMPSEIPDSLRRRIEGSEEWKRYRRLLQKVADAQAGEESSHPDSEETLEVLFPEIENGTNLDEEGWTPIAHADWRDDAAHALKPPTFLRPIEAARLDAIATLHAAAAAKVQSTLPQTKHELEICLWPLFSKYAEDVFDKMAEVKLSSTRPSGRSGTYSRWLRSKCLPAVVDDVCRLVLGQFPITVRHVVETIGERQSAEIASTRRALLGILTEVMGGPFTENLRNSLSAGLEGRSTHWEAQFERASQSRTAAVSSGSVIRRTGMKSRRQLAAHRNRLLIEAQERWRPIAGRRIPFAWIHKQAGVDHKDAYSWKSGELSVRSIMTTNIERVLKSAAPPKPKLKRD